MDYEQVLEWFKSGEAKAEQLVEIREAINEIVPLVEEREQAYWEVEGDPLAIQLGTETFALITRGRAQLSQIACLREWLKVYAKPAVTEIYGKQKDGENLGVEAGFNLALELLDEDALVELGVLVTGSEKDFVEEHFDLGWVFDAAVKIIKHQPAIQRIVSGFFGRRG
jgi:hypothetical protein